MMRRIISNLDEIDIMQSFMMQKIYPARRHNLYYVRAAIDFSEHGWTVKTALQKHHQS